MKRSVTQTANYLCRDSTKDNRHNNSRVSTPEVSEEKEPSQQTKLEVARQQFFNELMKQSLIFQDMPTYQLAFSCETLANEIVASASPALSRSEKPKVTGRVPSQKLTNSKVGRTTGSSGHRQCDRLARTYMYGSRGSKQSLVGSTSSINSYTGRKLCIPSPINKHKPLSTIPKPTNRGTVSSRVPTPCGPRHQTVTHPAARQSQERRRAVPVMGRTASQNRRRISQASPRGTATAATTAVAVAEKTASPPAPEAVSQPEKTKPSMVAEIDIVTGTDTASETARKILSPAAITDPVQEEQLPSSVTAPTTSETGRDGVSSITVADPIEKSESSGETPNDTVKLQSKEVEATDLKDPETAEEAGQLHTQMIIRAGDEAPPKPQRLYV